MAGWMYIKENMVWNPIITDDQCVIYDMYIYIYVYMMMIWLVVYLPLWKIWKSSWDDDIPNIWKNRIHVPNYQPEKMSVESQCGGIF